ncbi:hypothetical protein BRD00_00600 [Halobacteriales archaeon QS_8_69_26]|nr:MAG: hypothetical protein BRD00_00600 [Halobacteriales archaeon QS_8_69_26]
MTTGRTERVAADETASRTTETVRSNALLLRVCTATASSAASTSLPRRARRCALTLIEREALDAVEADYGFALGPGVHRRNVTTEGVALAHLVGERFRVGEAVCVGTERCEPCAYLERHLEREGVREALVHRGGLRARIVAGGTVAVGDAVGTAGVGERTN